MFLNALKENFSKELAKQIFSAMAEKLNLNFITNIFPVIALKIFLAGFLEKFAFNMCSISKYINS